MKLSTTLFTTITTIALCLAIVASFFTIKDFYINNLKIPQLFYFFLFIASIGFCVLLQRSSEYRLQAKELIREYGVAIAVFFFFIALNIGWYFHSASQMPKPYFLINVYRFSTLLLFSFILIIHTTTYKKMPVWVSRTLFIPLIFSPLLFFRNLDNARDLFPSFFSGYRLQGLLYNETSLSVWLLITLGVSTHFLFKALENQEKYKILLYSLCTFFSISLLWWTHSRAGIVFAMIFFWFTSYVFLKKQRLGLWLSIILTIGLFSTSLLLLPPKAKVSIFFRYYPDQIQEVQLRENNKGGIQSEIIAKNMTSDLPNFTHSQDRLNLWKSYGAYIVSRPLGSFGPAIFTTKTPELVERAHNSVLQAGMWGGWVTLILVGVFFLQLVYKSHLLLLRARADAFILGIIAGFCGVLLLAMLNSYLDFKVFWVLISLIISYSALQKKTLEQPVIPHRPTT